MKNGKANGTAAATKESEPLPPYLTDPDSWYLIAPPEAEPEPEPEPEPETEPVRLALKITIENTAEIIEVNGIPCRLSAGNTGGAIEVQCLVTVREKRRPDHEAVNVAPQRAL